jgi:PAS domain-containing protein
LLSPFLFALLIGLCSALGLFALPNGIVADLLMRGMAAGEAQSLIVRAPVSEIGKVRSALTRDGLEVAGATGKNAIPVVSFGITRSFRGGDGEERIIVLPPDSTTPELSATQIASGAVPRALLAGKLLVVGSPRDRGRPPFTVSAFETESALDETQFDARIHQAQRLGKVASIARGPALFAILLAVAATFLFLKHALRPSWRMAGTATVLLVIIIGSYAALRWGGLLMPFSEMTVLAILVAVGARRESDRERERRMDLLTDRASSFVTRNSLVADQRRWVEYVPAMLRLAGAEKILLLQESKDDGSLEVLASTWTEDADLPDLVRTDEFNRADEQRPTALSLASSSGLDPYLSRLDRFDAGLYCLFYLAPDERKVSTLAAVQRVLTAASQLRALGPSSMRARKRHGADVRLFGALGAILSRSAELHQTLGALQAATMMFDATGMPVQVNGAMERLLGRAGIQPARATPLDVANSLTEVDEEQVRQLLSELIRHGGSVRLTPRAEVAGRSYEVRASLIEGQLLFEVTDVTNQFRLARIQAELAGEIDARIRNDLEAIELASGLAANKRLSAERRGRAMEMVGQTVARTRRTLEDLSRLITGVEFTGEGEPYPVNPRSALVQAVTILRPAAAARGVILDVEQPELTSLVIAEPDELDALLSAMIQTVIDDSTADSHIAIRLEEEVGNSIISVQGGFGLPSDRFASAMNSETKEVTEPYRMLQRGAALAARWGGSFEASSEAGAGYRFVLRLGRSSG